MVALLYSFKSYIMFEVSTGHKNLLNYLYCKICEKFLDGISKTFHHEDEHAKADILRSPITEVEIIIYNDSFHCYCPRQQNKAIQKNYHRRKLVLLCKSIVLIMVFFFLHLFVLEIRDSIHLLRHVKL